MSSTTYDDDDYAHIAYSTAWSTVGAKNWFGGGFHSCNTGAITGAKMCTASITVESGTHITVYGDANPAQSKFFCQLDDGPYVWFDGGRFVTGNVTNITLNHVRCSVQGIENGPHTLVFGQDAVSAGKNGVTLDYYVVDDIVAPGSTAVWSSNFASTTPQIGYGNTTAIASAVLSTSISTPASSSSSAPSSSASSSPSNGGGGGGMSTATGAGIGVGVGAVGLAVLGLALWLCRRRRRNSSDASGTTRRSGGRRSLDTTHDLDNMTLREGAQPTVAPYSSYSPVSRAGAASVPEIQQDGTRYAESHLPYDARSQAGGLEHPTTFSSRGGTRES